MTAPDPEDLAELFASNLEDQPPEVQQVIRYAWARAALDWGILLLVGEEHEGGIDRLICTLQEDGSCFVVERPPRWSHEEEALYVARFKQILGGA